jgi:dihydroorotase
MRIAITGGHIIDPAHHFNQPADLYINDQHIVGVGHCPDGFQAEQTLDVRGCNIIPGVIDACARLREPGAEHKATIASETKAAAAHGITTVIVPPDTTPIIDEPAVAELILRRAQHTAHARVLPLAALTTQLRGEQLSEMAMLKQAGCVAVSDGGKPIANSLVLRRALEYANCQGLHIHLTPEDPWLASAGCVHEGTVATRLGLPAISVAAETAALARNLAIVEQTGAHAHFGRLSSARGCDFISLGRQSGIRVSADVAIHQLFLTEMDIAEFDATCHVRPPLRSQGDREALRHAVREGIIDVICSDHQPHDADAKLAPFPATEPGISSIETLLPLTLRLVQEGLLDLPNAIARITTGPARALGIGETYGHLGIGAVADLCIYDPHAVWWLRAAEHRSRGTHNPFARWEFTGRVVHTFVGGKRVYSLKN